MSKFCKNLVFHSRRVRGGVCAGALFFRYQPSDVADAEVGQGGDDDSDAHELEGLLGYYQGNMMREEHSAGGYEKIGQHIADSA